MTTNTKTGFPISLGRYLLSICCFLPFILSFFQGTVNSLSPYVGTILTIGIFLSCVGSILFLKLSNVPPINLIPCTIGTGILGTVLLYLLIIGEQSVMVQYLIAVIPVGWLFLPLILSMIPNQGTCQQKSLLRTCLIIAIYPPAVFVLSLVWNYMSSANIFLIFGIHMYIMLISFPLWVLGFQLLGIEFPEKTENDVNV